MTPPRPATRVIAATLLAAMLGFGSAACSSSSGSDGTKDSTATVDSSAAQVDASTTTKAPATATTEPAEAVGTPTPLETSQRLYDSWKANDKATAATVADPAALAGMWKTAPGDYSVYNACDTGEFESSGCLFRGNAGTIQFDLERRGELWVAVDAFYSAP